MGLPVCFEDIEITEDDFDAMAEKAMTTTEWDFKPENAGVTKESFIQCMKETDEYGRSINLICKLANCRFRVYDKNK